jgi:redox-sensitive bicupin YhaK (pirin superfamily)
VTPDSRVLLAPDDGSLGPLLHVAEDRLAPRSGYGRHAHRAVDVVAVVLAGDLQHSGDGAARLAAGDVGILHAGAGLEHDEIAGPGGARVLQSYLRSAAPTAPAAYRVTASSGWIDLDRPDARLWCRRLAAGEEASPPAGFRLRAEENAVHLDGHVPQSPVTAAEPTVVLVWQLDRTRPSWAAD